MTQRLHTHTCTTFASKHTNKSRNVRRADTFPNPNNIIALSLMHPSPPSPPHPPHCTGAQICVWYIIPFVCVFAIHIQYADDGLSAPHTWISRHTQYTQYTIPRLCVCVPCRRLSATKYYNVSRQSRHSVRFVRVKSHPRTHFVSQLCPIICLILFYQCTMYGYRVQPSLRS